MWLRKSFDKLQFRDLDLKESAETVIMAAEGATDTTADQGGMKAIYKRLKKVNIQLRNVRILAH